MLENKFTFDKIVGESEAMQEIYQALSKIIKYDTPVLIEGETGTGKELITNAIHYNSSRKNKQLIAINCGMLSEHLLESELFGHTKGAFTGAFNDKEGLFETADKGTIFLDEVAELTENLQVKLLRILQNGELRKIGSTKHKKVDVRIISATNKNLSEEVAKGNFRKDLYFRLNVFSIKLPSLKERKEDIPLLAKYFLEKLNKATGKEVKGFTKGALNWLSCYDWQGNVRELENIIQKAFITTETQLIEIDNLTAKSIKNSSAPDKKLSPIVESEKNHIMETLVKNGWNKTKTTKELGMSRPTLDRKIKKYGIQEKEK